MSKWANNEEQFGYPSLEIYMLTAHDHSTRVAFTINADLYRP